MRFGPVANGVTGLIGGGLLGTAVVGAVAAAPLPTPEVGSLLFWAPALWGALGGAVLGSLCDGLADDAVDLVRYRASQALDLVHRG